MSKETLTDFEQLHTWQRAADLAAITYEITKDFPVAEKFALTDQLQRSAVSVSANIAEGFGRTTTADKLHFYSIAHGSLLETKSHLLIAARIGYVSSEQLAKVLPIITDTKKLIIGSKRALKQNG